MAVQRKGGRHVKPAPVNIVDTEKPIPVILEGKPNEVIDKRSGKTLAPTTTEQEDITTAGQRKVNLIWEYTQSFIAVLITGAIIYCIVNRIESEILSNAFFLIVSMYFVRTNHTLIGGVGKKPIQNYEGR